jgi:hypothetical protein
MESGPSAGGRAAGAPRVFIAYADDDAEFVRTCLVGMLGLGLDEVQLSGELEPGSMIIDELERGVQRTLTLAVLSPSFLVSPMARFAEAMAQLQRLEAGAGASTLVPLLRADCELPPRLRMLVPLNFRDDASEGWDDEAAKLRRRLGIPLISAPLPPPCPYPGMKPFTGEQSASFYGRKREIGELLDRLRGGERELYVIGPSGSGKSSLVDAGLVPALRGGAARAGASFMIRSLRSEERRVGKECRRV